MIQPDLKALAEALRAHDAERLLHLGGLEFGASAMERLLAMTAGSVTTEDLLGALVEAAHGEVGVAVREVLDRSLGFVWGKHFCLAIRHGEEVTLAVGHATNTPMRVSHVWPTLKPWYAQLDRNRVRAEAWAQAAERAADAIRVGRRSDHSEPKDALGESELIAAIVADPEDREARLVYADWLLERGDRRGELVRGDRLGDQQLEAAPDRQLVGEVARIAKAHPLERAWVPGDDAELRARLAARLRPRDGGEAQVEAARGVSAPAPAQALARPRAGLKPVSVGAGV